MLSHRSGVAALDVSISNDQAVALDPVLRLIEQQRPWWRPGAQHGYHAVTYGFILSGLIRAVTGRTVGEFFADEVARPLELDLYIGLPPESHATVAPMVGPSQRQAIRRCESGLAPVCWGSQPALGVLPRKFEGPRSASRSSELDRYEVEDLLGRRGNGAHCAKCAAVIGGRRRRLIIPSENPRGEPQASGYEVVLGCGPTGTRLLLFRAAPMWPDVGGPGIVGPPAPVSWLRRRPNRRAFGYTTNLWLSLRFVHCARFGSRVTEAVTIRRCT